MLKYHNLLNEIRVVFPKATLISLSVTTQDSEVDAFKNAVKNIVGAQITIDNHLVNEPEYIKYTCPLGTINLNNG